MWIKECGPCPVFACFTLTFALHMRKKHGKTSVRVVIHKHTMELRGPLLALTCYAPSVPIA